MYEFNVAGFTLKKSQELGFRLGVILHDQGHIHVALYRSNHQQSNSRCTATAVSKQVVFQTRPEAVNVAGCCKLIFFAPFQLCRGTLYISLGHAALFAAAANSLK